jgi:hypothetical protein
MRSYQLINRLNINIPQTIICFFFQFIHVQNEIQKVTLTVSHVALGFTYIINKTLFKKKLTKRVYSFK